jgi:septal ring factor EnvC (AmiA/AmiB activator)
MDLKKTFLISLIVFSSLVWGRPAPFKKITEFQSELKTLEKDINKLDHTLGKKNKRYIELIEKRKFLELKTRELNLEILERARFLKNEIKGIKKLLAKNLIQSLNEKEDSADMLARIVLRKHLKKKLSNYQQNLDSVEDLQKKTKFLEEKIEEYYGIETSLLALIEELERKKLEELTDYREKRRKFKQLNKKFKKLKSNKRKITKTKSFLNIKDFIFPVENYSKVKKHRKGINISLKGNKPIKATRDGKVIYIGDLSTFGHVLMLDHGNETRSVIFGPFTTKVAKGDKVKKGQMIGQTPRNGTKLNVINFGIWYKNKAQDTAKLFAKRI